MMHTPSLSIAQRRAEILERIAAAAGGREVTLIAASKRQPDERIEQMLSAGQIVFGENRVQEAEQHWSYRKSKTGANLRLIGPLQTNKSEQAIRLFDVIETLDRPKLAKALRAAADKIGAEPPPVLIQVNTGEEPQKAGAAPGDVEEMLQIARGEYGLDVCGLMCIPPATEPPGPHFALLAKLAERFDLAELSMGMSGDFETAIRFGATHVRVGSALFGERIQQG